MDVMPSNNIPSYTEYYIDFPMKTDLYFRLNEFPTDFNAILLWLTFPQDVPHVQKTFKCIHVSCVDHYQGQVRDSSEDKCTAMTQNDLQWKSERRNFDCQ